MCKLREIIGRHAYTMFMPIKQDLLVKRIALMKADKKQEYLQAINKANTEYARCNMTVSKAAGEWLDMDENSFGLSMREAMQDPEISKEMRKADENLRMVMEPMAEKPLSREKAKEIHMERIKMEFEAERKLKDLQVPSQEQAQQIVVFEKTKVMD